MLRSVSINGQIKAIGTGNTGMMRVNYDDILALLHEARHSLRLQSTAPTAVAIPSLSPFTYFDEVRKVVETATSDVFFVDPYLDAEFVARYLPNVKQSTIVRLLTQKGLATLLPAVALFAQQHGVAVQVRSASTKLHDRFVFIDRARGYQSGASFKDGGLNAPTTLTEMVDVFQAVIETYEDVWAKAKTEN